MRGRSPTVLASRHISGGRRLAGPRPGELSFEIKCRTTADDQLRPPPTGWPAWRVGPKSSAPSMEIRGRVRARLTRSDRAHLATADRGRFPRRGPTRHENEPALVRGSREAPREFLIPPGCAARDATSGSPHSSRRCPRPAAALAIFGAKRVGDREEPRRHVRSRLEQSILAMAQQGFLRDVARSMPQAK